MPSSFAARTRIRRFVFARTCIAISNRPPRRLWYPSDDGTSSLTSAVLEFQSISGAAAARFRAPTSAIYPELFAFRRRYGIADIVKFGHSARCAGPPSFPVILRIYAEIYGEGEHGNRREHGRGPENTELLVVPFPPRFPPRFSVHVIRQARMSCSSRDRHSGSVTISVFVSVKRDTER